MKVDHWQALVVEDDYDSLQVVRQALEFSGAQVETAETGSRALEMLRHLAPALIVLDLALPDIDGWQTLKAIRANPATADIPVIAITAYHSVQVVEEALKAGFNAYYSKPLDIQAFLAGLKEFVN
jgi:CheY-like chemotaxis protein